VREYIARTGCALVLATQNLADVMTLCTKVMVLDEGRPIAMLDVSAIETSQDRYLQAIVGESGHS
jgi:ABC-type uncharacterized transport system ATPase subunit